MSTRRLGQPARFVVALVLALSAAVFGLSSNRRITRVDAASIDVLMNLSDTRQTIDGFGASDAWNDDATPLFSDSEMDLFFSPQNGIGLSFLRLSIQPDGSNSTSLSIAQRAAARGARVWAAPWSAPASWKDNGSTLYGGHLCAYAGQGSCTAEHYSDWATRLASFATTLKASGVDLYGISVQNEPDFTASYDSMLFTEQEMVNFVKTLGPRLAAMNPRPKLVVGDYADWSHIWNLASMVQSDPVAASYTDIYAVHQYFGTSSYQNQLPRPLWQTEMSGFDSFNAGIDNAIGVADWINDALVNGNVNSWHYWWLRGLNDDNEGLVGHASDTYALTKRLYAMGNYSRFVRPGWVRLGTSGSASNMTTLAFRNPSTNEIALVVVNHGGAATATFGVSGSFQSAVTPYQTYDDGSGNFSLGSHGNLEPRAAISAAGSNAFTATVPHGVTTFVGTASSAQSVAPPGAFSKSSPGYGATGQGTSVTLTWAAASGATSYEYCVDAVNDNACSNWTSAGSATSAFVSGLSSGTSYFWHVRASNAGGTTYADGSASAFSTFTTATGAPGSFNKTSPASGATGQSTGLTLSWGSSSGATNYEYCIDATNDGVCSNWISTGTSTSAFAAGLAQGTTYYWHVRASNAAATTYAAGGSAAFWSFSTFSSAPGAFNKQSPTNGATGQSTSLTLTWSGAAGATSYEYCLDATNDNACAAWTSTGSATSVFVGGLAAGTTYYWQVRASNAGGSTYADGAASAYAAFATQSGVAGAFSKLSPANGATGQATSLTLTWRASSGASSYDYCIDTTNDNACSGWTSVGAATSAALNGLSQGVTYYWHVRANNAGGTTYADGSTSAFFNFTTQVGAPGSFTKVSPANTATGQGTGLTLSWGSASGATNYEYCIDATNDGGCSAWSSTGTSTSAFISGLAPGTTYYWHVRAGNAGGTTYAVGGSAAFWSFTTVTGAPGAFNKLSPRNDSGGQAISPLLAWSASAGATGYEYCLDRYGNCTTWITVGASTSVSPGGLQAGSTYYWTVRAVNGGGTAYANNGAFDVWSFTTQVFQSAVTTTAATILSTTAVTLNGIVNPGGQSTATAFEYGPTTAYGAVAPGPTLSGTFEQSVSAVVTLSCGTSSHFRARASNSNGVQYGSDQIVVMPACAPVVATGTAGRSGTPETTVGGTVNPMGDVTSAWFEYGTSAAYGSFVSVSPSPGGGNATIPVSVTLSGLSCGATYHFRLVVSSSGGTVTGADATFVACDAATTRSWVTGDADGDGKADASIYRAATGEWVRLSSSGGSRSSYPWGLAGDVPVPGDYDGDGKTDLAIYRPTTATWWIAASRSAFQTYSGYAWGSVGDIPVPADYDGDGTTDLAVYRPSTGGWWVLTSGSGFRTYTSHAWGLPGDLPVPADYDGDGTIDPAIYRPSTGGWWVLKSSTGYTSYSGVAWGLAGDMPVPGDYDGDGKSDVAIFRPSTGVWWIAFSKTNFTTYAGHPWGYATDVAVPADYDGDGKTDIAVFRPTTGEWWILTSSSDFKAFTGLTLGGAADTPLNSVNMTTAP